MGILAYKVKYTCIGIKNAVTKYTKILLKIKNNNFNYNFQETIDYKAFTQSKH